MSSEEIIKPSEGCTSNWTICDSTGRVLRSPPSGRKFSLMGRKSIISLRTSVPSWVHSFFGTTKSPPKMGCPSTQNASESGIIPHTCRLMRPSTTSFQASGGTCTRGGLIHVREAIGFSHLSGWSKKSLKPSLDTSAAGKIPAKPCAGKLVAMFSHLKGFATCTSSPYELIHL